MRVPPEITFRGMEGSEELESLIRGQMSKLERVCDYLISCRIAVERTQRHSHPGEVYETRIDMRVPPGHELVTRRRSGQSLRRNTVEGVIRDAFDGARRQLKRQVERQAGEMKLHPDQEANGIVEQIFPDEGYGFLRDHAGKQIYFHRNSVAGNRFDDLRSGNSVIFVEREGEKGPQASTVRIVDHRGHGAVEQVER